MSHKDGVCMYDKNHVLQIFDKNKGMEERNINISIMNLNDILQIKLRDPLEYCFNYTENLDLGDFELIRVNQNLDINFNEFKYNLIEMLEQFQKKEMLLKCEIFNQKCTLVFYCKSKIKSIIYLTIDLHLTNQKEIFTELINNMQSIQETNERLKKQLSSVRKTIIEKDEENHRLVALKNELQQQFNNNIKQLNNMFNVKLEEVQNLLISKIVSTKQRVVKLLNDVDVLKRETKKKSDSSIDLVKSLENLKLDLNTNLATINNLKKENSALHAAKFNQDRYIADLKKSLQEKETFVGELQKRNGELKSDLDQVTALMGQKKATVDELSKDLVQANQMLVNYNNHYDNKVKQVEELKEALAANDAALREQKLRTNEIVREFENYKTQFNNEEQEKLKHELLLASNKLVEMENALRKANKINVLLTEKVNNAGFNPH